MDRFVFFLGGVGVESKNKRETESKRERENEEACLELANPLPFDPLM